MKLFSWQRAFRLACRCLSKVTFGIQRMSTPVPAPTPTGLFGIQNLLNPSDFISLASQACQRCDELVQLLQKTPPSLQSLKIVDEMSDTLCRIADASELCRNVHPDRKWVKAAETSYAQIFSRMTKLNTSPTVFEGIQKVCENSDLMKGFTNEQRRVALQLKHDMEVSGIGLPESQRRMARKLQESICNHEYQFTRNATDSNDEAILPICLDHLPPSVRAFCRAVPGTNDCVVPVTPKSSYTLLQTIPNPALRKKIFILSQQTAADNLPVLDELVRERHRHAALLGFPSFAHLRLSQMLENSPEKVGSFLSDLSDRVAPKAQVELQNLGSIKQEFEGSSDIDAWDVPFYSSIMRRRILNNSLFTSVSAFFALENILTGLNAITTRVFNCRLREVPVPESQHWCSSLGPQHLNDVRRFDVHCATDNSLLGSIFMDLHTRPGKFPCAAHFAIRHAHEASPEMPSVAIVCSFPRATRTTPSLLAHADLVSLFHETGHALHAVLSRSQFQHLAGTRGPFDFVEIPSNLMEFFAWDYRVLSLFARHYISGHTIPESLVSNLSMSKRMFSGIETQTQLVYALFDQVLSGTDPLRHSTTETLHRIQSEHSSISCVTDTHAQTRFTHICGYGACYHSYLSCRVIAAHIWREFFAADPLCSRAGTRLRELLLLPGNSIHPQDTLQSYLGGQSASIDAFVRDEVEHKDL